jgi:phage tail-like protein
MATTTRPLVSDPLRSFKFNVIIPLVTNSTLAQYGGEARFGFMSMSGLGIAIEPLTYREGGDNLTTRKMPGQADFNPITLSRGLFPTDNDNWIWMQQLFTAMYGTAPGLQTPASPDFRLTMYINILEHPNTTSQAPGTQYGVSYPAQNNIVKWSAKLYSAWIGSLAYSDLDAGGNAVAVEQMTINYEGFDTQWAGGAGQYVANPTSW